jgi:hypothetical protein
MNSELAAPALAPEGDNDVLFARLYDELHRIARREVARSGSDGAASPTTLLH